MKRVNCGHTGDDTWFAPTQDENSLVHDMEISIDNEQVGSDHRLFLRVPAATASLRTLRTAVAGWLSEEGVPAPIAVDIVLAAHEAAANAVEHPLGQDRGDVVLVGERHQQEVVIEVRDSGRWSPLPSSPDRGRGLLLIDGLMDDARVRTSPSGTEVRLVRRLDTILP